MEFGSEKWFEKVKENYSFPCTVAFYVCGEGDIYTRVVDSNFERLGASSGLHLLDNGKSVVLKEVAVLDSVEEYYRVSKRIKGWMER